MAVAEELHFGRAARRLHVSQPPLSQQLRLFEERVGVKLIERSTRAVRLTAAGAVLLEAGRRLEADGEAALARGRRVDAGEAGMLRVGFTPTAAYRLVPAAVGAYRQRHAEVHLSMQESNSSVLQAALLQERLDIALMRRGDDAADQELAFVRIDQEPLIVALPAGHPLARRPRVPIGRLAEQPLIGFARETSPYFYLLLDELFTRNGVTPHYAMESLMPTMLALVESGIGVAIVPASVRDLRPKGVAYRPLEAAHCPLSTLYAAYRRDTLNPAVRTFVDVLAEAGDAGGP